MLFFFFFFEIVLGIAEDNLELLSGLPIFIFQLLKFQVTMPGTCALLTHFLRIMKVKNKKLMKRQEKERKEEKERDTLFLLSSLEKQLLFILKEDHLSLAISQIDTNLYNTARLSREDKVGN